MYLLRMPTTMTLEESRRLERTKLDLVNDYVRAQLPRGVVEAEYLGDHRMRVVRWAVDADGKTLVVDRQRQYATETVDVAGAPPWLDWD